ncbi:MAG: glutaredoxin family protein [Chloroflexia bacterium]
MDVHRVDGQDRGDVFLYALSTCVWCRRTKALLQELGVAYRYIDVDLVPQDEQQEVMEQVARWNPQRNFPTLVIRNSQVIIGYQPERIREALS